MIYELFWSGRRARTKEALLTQTYAHTHTFRSKRGARACEKGADFDIIEVLLLQRYNCAIEKVLMTRALCIVCECNAVGLR